jgi:hypothetical protein
MLLPLRQLALAAELRLSYLAVSLPVNALMPSSWPDWSSLGLMEKLLGLCAVQTWLLWAFTSGLGDEKCSMRYRILGPGGVLGDRKQETDQIFLPGN